MDCPRCGVSVFAELNSCRGCGWQLSRPFLLDPATTSTSAKPPDISVTAALPPIQTAADAFALSPPTQRARAAQQRRLARRRSWTGAPENPVALLPAEARWEVPPRFEVIEMPLVQSAFDFAAAEEEAERLAAVAAAPVGVRFRAGLLDATLILLATGVFFGLFALLSREVSFARRDLLIYLVAGFALASAYFALFTLLGGRTPGMQYYGLRVVTFAGTPLPARVGLGRAFGYLVSIGSLLLGFCWALVDERRLTWHDHVSKTFLTDRPLS
ncbi:MAG: RDD family protein [Acidobacteria bacterium]|nr:RDD family protein [Acidobacteriota bacterium]